MKTYLILPALFISFQSISQQSAAPQLTEPIIIRSVDPEDDDFSDLLPLIEKIGTSQVVALGECTHEDGATFKAKARLVKFLHQKMGFDVLLWESGMLDDWYMNAALRSDSSMRRAVAFERGRWGAGEYSGAVFEYAKVSWNTSHPIEMGGFDFGAAGTGAQTATALLHYVIKKVPSLQPDKEEWIAIDSLLRGFLSYASSNNLIAQKMSAVSRERGMRAIKKIIQQAETNKHVFLKVMGTKEFDFTLFMLKNIIRDLDVNLLFMANYMGNTFDGFAWNAKRDADMAERLLWMTDNIYKGRKIILWGASSHFMKNSKGFISRDDTVTKWNYYQMGDYVTKKLKNDYYVIAFTSYQGQKGTIYSDKEMNDEYGYIDTIKEKAKGSLEQIANQYGKPYLFVDLKNLPKDHWLRKPAIAYVFGNTKDKTNWSKMIDAFFFIDTMEPDQKRW